MRAGGVQPFDTGARQGWPGLTVSFPQGIGNEFSGTVDEVGEGVTGFSVGEAVLGWTYMAALAEYVVVDAQSLVKKPASLSWEVAGALSASGQTACTVLKALEVSEGDTVLIHAAAGGVGTVAVQLARLRGATVIGTASEANHAYLKDLGAIPVTYGEGLVDRVRAVAPDGVDAVIDGIGGQALRDSPALVEDPGRIITLADDDIAAEIGARSIRSQRSAAQLAELADLCERGDLRIHIRATFPLDQVVLAHREVERGHGRGKVVVTVP